LSNVIGSTYGGDANNFNLPDFTSRVPICSQKLDPINIQYQGASTYKGGNKSMDSNQLASHAHGLTHKHNYNYNINNLSNGNTYNSLISTSGCNAIRNFVYNATNNYLNTTEKTSGTTGNAGGTVNGTPLEFLPPFCVVNFIIYTGKTS
jgi:microcystin-dependent protein